MSEAEYISNKYYQVNIRFPKEYEQVIKDAAGNKTVPKFIAGIVADELGIDITIGDNLAEKNRSENNYANSIGYYAPSQIAKMLGTYRQRIVTNKQSIEQFSKVIGNRTYYSIEAVEFLRKKWNM